MDNNNEWTTSSCPICGRDFPHKVRYSPKTCGNLVCFQEAYQRGMLYVDLKEDGPVAPVTRDLETLAKARDDAEVTLLEEIRKADSVTGDIEDYWKHQVSGAEV